MKNILITGSNGFIGSNLISFLKEEKKYKLILFSKKDSDENLKTKVLISDIIFHLAGENKSKTFNNFLKNNVHLTQRIINILETKKKRTPIVYTSTTKVKENNFYGKTKLKAEYIIKSYGKKNKVPIKILRVPNVFGKWARPNYNSFLTTICYNLPRKKKINILNKKYKIKLIYIDNLIKILISCIKTKNKIELIKVLPDKTLTLGELFNLISSIWNNHKKGIVPNLNNNFIANLYTTFLSYLPINKTIHTLNKKKDDRGYFSEILKQSEFGQVSVFSINPGKKRGGHFHHTKHEKFLLISGNAEYNSIDIKTKKKYSIKLNENKLKNFVSIPGSWHEIRNTGKNKAYFLLWSSEIFNKRKPDTYFNRTI